MRGYRSTSPRCTRAKTMAEDRPPVVLRSVDQALQPGQVPQKVRVTR